MCSSSSDESLCWERDGTGAKEGKKPSRMRKSRPGNGNVAVKVKKLQKLVPGGQDLKTERLLSRTADYIVQMRYQVKLLQALLKLHRHHHPTTSSSL